MMIEESELISLLPWARYDVRWKKFTYL